MSYDIARKIKQLVAQAESESKLGNSEFADTIMQKVRQLLERHGLSLLTIATSLSDDPVGNDKDAVRFWQSEGWMSNLVKAVGKFYGVTPIFGRGLGNHSPNLNSIAVIGRESCRAAFCAMMPYLKAEVRRLGALRTKEGVYRSLSVANRSIGNALTHRILKLCRERDQAMASQPHTVSGMNALVPVDIIDIVLKREYPNSYTTPSRPFKYEPSARSDAESIPLVDQVAGVGTLQIGKST